MRKINKLEQRRRERIRRRIRQSPLVRPRLSVFRSNKYIYAQVIDDSDGRTVAAASSHENGEGRAGDKEAAAVVGKLVAERAKAAGVTTVVFDRGGYKYHGRVKALADATREAGIQF